jgi:hypothetical protein
VKILDEHWKVGLYSKYTREETILVDWEAVRTTMSPKEKKLDDIESGHVDFTNRYFRYLRDRFVAERGRMLPLRYSGRMLLFALKKRFTFFDFSKYETSDEAYEENPGLLQIIENGRRDPRASLASVKEDRDGNDA